MDPEQQRMMMAQQLMGAPPQMSPQAMPQVPMGVQLQGMPGMPQVSPSQNPQLATMMQGMMGPQGGSQGMPQRMAPIGANIIGQLPAFDPLHPSAPHQSSLFPQDLHMR